MPHSVLDLNVHTPEQTPVVWLARTWQEGAIAAAERPLKKSKFLAYFDLCRTTNDVYRILLERIKFVDVPEFFTCDRKERKWNARKRQGFRMLGKLYPVSPKHVEQFWLRAIVQHRPFITSYEDTRTVDGVEHQSFRQAAVALGLARDDQEHRNVLEEAKTGSTPFSMRALFLMLLLHAGPAQPKEL
ncbi:uncharacterized protein LOC135945154 [Cloeon dipterum]|uniref:uncharacterized protein LOC135945154 n=1 Tax=Cloeon dipterum TaxID=197152 RepID=UPI0032200E8C